MEGSRTARGAWTALLAPAALVCVLAGCGGRLVEPMSPAPPVGTPLPPTIGQNDSPATPPAASLEAVPTVPAGSVVSLPARSGTPRYHTVAAGESVSAIARRYQVSPARLQQENGLDAGDSLQPGQILYVPE